MTSRQAEAHNEERAKGQQQDMDRWLVEKWQNMQERHVHCVMGVQGQQNYLGVEMGLTCACFLQDACLQIMATQCMSLGTRCWRTA